MSDPNWISVKERLPETNPIFPDRYLVAHGDCVLEAKFNLGKWYSVVESNILEPTHWMPLPDPPHLSAFDDWQNRLPSKCINGEFQLEIFGHCVPKRIAKLIWDAAIASFKFPDSLE